MEQIKFPECNTNYGPPPDMVESQCRTIPAYQGEIKTGSLEGARIVVVAHKPNAAELAALNAGGTIFLTMVGGLSPHLLTTSFEEATNIA